MTGTACKDRTDCAVFVVARFTDAPADDMSVGQTMVVGPCHRITSLIWDACDTYALDYEHAGISDHFNPGK